MGEPNVPLPAEKTTKASTGHGFLQRPAPVVWRRPRCLAGARHNPRIGFSATWQSRLVQPASFPPHTPHPAPLTALKLPTRPVRRCDRPGPTGPTPRACHMPIWLSNIQTNPNESFCPWGNPTFPCLQRKQQSQAHYVKAYRSQNIGMG